MKVAPLDRVGVYIPGGKASYPSTVIMNAVPALVAGVQEIIAVIPPGGVTDVVLAACALSGVTRVFQIGGVQAIAALAYGTRTIPRVDKIVGPGNRWVAEAKRQVAGYVGIDMIAGPTEVLIIADESALPERVAVDMIAQAEHDEDATSWCVTTSPDLAEVLPAALEAALAVTPREPIARQALERNGLIVLAGSMREAIEVVNRRAPSTCRSLQTAPSGSPAPSGTLGPSFWATALPSRWATTSPGPATCCRPVAPRATPPPSGSTTS